MKYVEVNQDKAEQIMQDIYRFMPLFVTVNGDMVRVIAQQSETVYYIKQ